MIMLHTVCITHLATLYMHAYTSSSFPKSKQKVVVSVQWLVLRRLRSTDDTSAETEGKRRRMGRAGEREEREGRIEAACIIAQRLRNLHACDSSIFKTRVVPNEILQEERKELLCIPFCTCTHTRSTVSQCRHCLCYCLLEWTQCRRCPQKILSERAHQDYTQPHLHQTRE